MTSADETVDLSLYGIDSERLELLYARIRADVQQELYPGAATALARNGKLIAKRNFGLARLATDNELARPVDDETLWLLYSQTKPVTSCAIWILCERGLLNFQEPVASYLPDFAKNGKEAITIYQVLSHQAGFPTANVPPEAWEDHRLMRMFYQMLLGLGSLNGVRILAPRTVQYVTRNHTGDRVDEFFNMPMHRGLGVHVRGTTPTIRGMSSIASPNCFGHGGAGTSYTWADPETGVSFTYLTNSRLPDPAHSRRLEEIMTLAHAAIVEL